MKYEYPSVKDFLDYIRKENRFTDHDAYTSLKAYKIEYNSHCHEESAVVIMSSDLDNVIKKFCNEVDNSIAAMKSMRIEAYPIEKGLIIGPFSIG